MNFTFSDKNLKELYEKGKNKKYKLDAAVIKKFILRVTTIENAVSIFDLRQPPSMHFEKLRGFENRFSIRIDKTYRLEFEIDFTNTEKTTGTVIICSISKHYQ